MRQREHANAQASDSELHYNAEKRSEVQCTVHPFLELRRPGAKEGRLEFHDGYCCFSTTAAEREGLMKKKRCVALSVGRMGEQGCEQEDGRVIYQVRLPGRQAGRRLR